VKSPPADELPHRKVFAGTPMHPPKVSIGLPVYNGERFLAEALDSFLAQTFSDFEVIVSDNASTDRTGEIARAYAARDARVRYHRNASNVGLARNHNRAFTLARGHYFKWAAADDVCRPDYLRRCVEVLDADPAVVLAYPRTQFVDAAGTPLDIDDPGWDLRSDDPAERLRYVLGAGHWVNAVIGLIRAEALARTRLMPTYPGGDFRVLAELSLLGKFCEIPERLFVRRLHPGASSQHGTDGTDPDPQWLVRYWTGNGASLALPLWSLSIDHFRTVVGSRLPLRRKLSLLGALLRNLRWRRQALAGELLSAAAALLGLGAARDRSAAHERPPRQPVAQPG
jgi:glycosyltransferase involved in cell wall biosynthesis